MPPMPDPLKIIEMADALSDTELEERKVSEGVEHQPQFTQEELRATREMLRASETTKRIMLIVYNLMKWTAAAGAAVAGAKVIYDMFLSKAH